ncbi:MAG: DUF362 domain-containing protein [Candidatus Firestonebacteria bacterium]
MVKVAIVKCDKYEEEKVENAIRKSLEQIGGLKKIIKTGDKVFLKPNFLTAKTPDEAVTTHPFIIKAVIKCVREVGGIISVGDCPGEVLLGIEKIWEITGVKKVCDEMGVELVNLEKSGSKEVVLNNGRRLVIAIPILECDCLISLPKFKSHTLTGLTGAIKNLFGTIPGLNKASYHRVCKGPADFASVTADILATVKPKLAIMDGVIGMDKDGPSAGRIRDIGVIMASYDCVALDTVMSHIVNYPPMKIDTIRVASEQDLGVADLKNIEVVGESLDAVIIKDFKMPFTVWKSRIPEFIKRFYWRQIKIKPYMDEKICTKCGTCAKICPVSAIKWVKGYPKVDYKKCIECLCCSELCKYKAVELEKSFLINLWLKSDKPSKF